MSIYKDLRQNSTITSPYVQMIIIQAVLANGENLVFRFTNSSDFPIYHDGFEYIPFPYQITGRASTTGQPPRPKLILSNVNKLVQPYLQQHNDLKGFKLTIIETLEKFLDGKVSSDPSATLPRQHYYINTMSSMDRTSISFELVNSLDMQNAKVPAAQALKDDLGTNDMYAPGLSIIRFRG